MLELKMTSHSGTLQSEQVTLSYGMVSCLGYKEVTITKTSHC